MTTTTRRLLRRRQGCSGASHSIAVTSPASRLTVSIQKVRSEKLKSISGIFSLFPRSGPFSKGALTAAAHATHPCARMCRMSQPVRQMRQSWSTEFSACGCTPYTCLCTNCAAADVHEHVEPGSWCSAIFGYIVCAAAGCTICFVRSLHAGRARQLCRTQSATLQARALARARARSRARARTCE